MSNGNGGLASGNIISAVLHSLYQVCAQLTGMFGLTPLQVLYGIGVLFVLTICFQIYGAVRGRTSFTFDEDNTT